MSLYLDTSVIVALFTVDASNARADAALRNAADVIVISNFAATEFASAVARKLRVGTVTASEARTAFTNFDTWVAAAAQSVDVTASDIADAQAFLRRLDLTLRTADAIHIAAARRLDAALLTFDNKMATCAKAIGCKATTA